MKATKTALESLVATGNIENDGDEFDEKRGWNVPRENRQVGTWELAIA